MAAKLQCEICGGKLVGKPGGIFECENCGTEYSTAWAREKIQEITGKVQVEGTVEVTGKVQVDGGTVQVEGAANAASYLRRGELALEDGRWDEAEGFFDKVLDIEPENARAYLGKLLAKQKLPSVENLKTQTEPFDDDKDYQKALRFADEELRQKLQDCDSAYREHVVRLKAEEEERRQWIRRLLSEAASWLAGFVSVGESHTVGLKADGTVVATQFEETRLRKHDGQCDVSGWRDIVAISAGYNHTVALKADGRLVAVGYNGCGEINVSGWRDIVAVSTGKYHTVGLKADGTVVATKYGDQTHYNGQCDVSGWRDIVAVSTGEYHTVGLKADGTVVATKYTGDPMFYHGQCDVSDWRDIVAVSAGKDHTVGLKADGTVVAVGNDLYGKRAVSGWKLFVNVEQAWQQNKARIEQMRKAAAERAEAERKAAAERAEAERKAAVERAEAERQAKIANLNQKKTDLRAELANLRGLFTGKRRREMEAQIAKADEQLAALQAELKSLE